MNKITGEELAFPVAGPTDKGFTDQPGMTLRQYFVGQVMSSMRALEFKNELVWADYCVRLSEAIINRLNKAE